MNTVHGVLDLLRGRLSESERRLAAAQAQEQARIDEREKEKAAVARYRTYAQQQEKAMYAQLMGKQIQASTFDDIHAAVAEMKSRCLAMEQAALEAAERASQAQKHTAAVRVEVSAHNVRTEKFTQWSDQITHQEHLEREHAEEQELEELVTSQTSRSPSPPARRQPGHITPCRKFAP